MRAYLIDELTEGNIEKIKDAMKCRGYAGGINDIYFFPVPEPLLTEEQRSHMAECGAHVMSLETGPTWVKLELLVRARGKIRCSCVSYATTEQRTHMQDFLDSLIRSLDIPV